MGFHLPFFPMYAAETLADGRFQGWNLEERGAWFTLLLANWNDGDIPASQTVLAKLLGCGPSDMARIWSAIGDRFIEVPDKQGRLWSPRLEQERENALKLSRTRARAGKEGARARWDKEKQSDGKRMRLPEQTHGKANAVAMRSECPQQSQSQSPSQINSSATRATPPSLDVCRVEWEREHPATAALLSALDAGGLRLRYSRKPDVSAGIEADVAKLGTESAAEVVRSEHAADPNANVAWYGRALHTAANGGRRQPPKAPSSLRWWDRLTPDEREEYVRQRAAIDPELADAPFGAVGVNRTADVAALHERWATKVQREAPA